jgi:hypothetical protein
MIGHNVGAVRSLSQRASDFSRSLWSRNSKVLLATAIAFMAVTASVRMYKGITLLVGGSLPGDVVEFFAELVPRWFAGLPVYSYADYAVHLPATYAILWPIFGTLSIVAARWVWIVLLLAALARLTYVTLRASGASSAAERAFIVLMPLSMYGVLLTLRIGQFGVFVLVLLIAGLFQLADNPPSSRRDLTTAILLLLALVKPTVAAPFICLALFLPGGLRPVLLAALGYVVLTLVAVSFQPDDFSTLAHDWQARSADLATYEGTANLHRWLAAAGLEAWLLPASLIALAAFGGWIYRNRHSDLWLLLGVAAIVARFWTYHRQYDDVLMLLPALALFRLVKRAPSGTAVDVVAGSLLALIVATFMTPVRFLTALHFQLVTTALAVIWCATLIFLARQVKLRSSEDNRGENLRAVSVAQEAFRS